MPGVELCHSRGTVNSFSKPVQARFAKLALAGMSHGSLLLHPRPTSRGLGMHCNRVRDTRRCIHLSEISNNALLAFPARRCIQFHPVVAYRKHAQLSSLSSVYSGFALCVVIWSSVCVLARNRLCTPP
jgi:hypothetical protein